MSEVRLVVREAEQDWSGTVHGSVADCAVAALSADPLTLEELEAAAERFAKRDPHGRYLANLRPGLHTEPHDAGVVIIDLVARLIVCDSTYSLCSREGTVDYHNGQCATDTALRYHLADDWVLSHDADTWEPLAERLRRERAARPVIHARDVFYGRPLLEFVARECFAAFGPSGAATEEDDDAVSAIHARWLLTPRDDLGGACPRDVTLERRGHIEWDLQDRCERWSRLGEAPPGLARSSHAFLHGGFGTHELVKYYDLVRALLWSCHDALAERARGGEAWPPYFEAGDFLATEVPRLEGVREAWFDAPDPEFHGRTPRSIIDRERARLPEALSAHEAVADPDCPCCQMMAELPGPMFWHLDGSGMDDDFAFDIRHRTREEWEEERRQWEEHSQRFNAEWAERERLGVTTQRPDEDAVWSRSYVAEGGGDVPLGVRAFGVGCRLAELIAALRAGAARDDTPAEAQSAIDRLNRDFGNLRDVLQSDDVSLAAALIEPVLDRFVATLEAVGADRADLAPRCEALADTLRTLLDPQTTDAFDAGDPFDIPF